MTTDDFTTAAVAPDDLDLPPHAGYWPTGAFAINADYCDGLTTSWRTLANDGVQIRRSGITLYVKQAGATVAYPLTADTLQGVAVYITEGTP